MVQCNVLSYQECFLNSIKLTYDSTPAQPVLPKPAQGRPSIPRVTGAGAVNRVQLWYSEHCDPARCSAVRPAALLRMPAQMLGRQNKVLSMHLDRQRRSRTEP